MTHGGRLMSEVRRAAEAARDAAEHVATLTTEQKNDYLRDLAGALVPATEDILRANAADLARIGLIGNVLGENYFHCWSLPLGSSGGYGILGHGFGPGNSPD